MAEALVFTFSRYFGGDDTMLLELLRGWPEARPLVALNEGHPARAQYEDAAAVRALPESDGPRPAAFLADLARFARLLREERPAAVLISTGGFPLAPYTWRFLCAAALAGVPRVVLAVHNYPNAATRYRRLMGKLAMLLCDEVLTVSRDCARALEPFNLRARPVRVVLNGIDGELPAADRRELAAADGPLIGAIGNLEDRKGFVVLAEAMRLVPQASCVIVGAPTPDGTEAALRAIAAEPALKGRLRLAGYLPKAWRFAGCFDICAIPSVRNESFGLLALDAMRGGRPVVATRVGGLPEVVEDGRTGLLVPPGDPAALAAALTRLLADPELARRLGEAGKRRWKELFTGGRMAREYHALLRSA